MRDARVRRGDAGVMRGAGALLASLITPPRCAVCEAPTRPSEQLCAKCESQLCSCEPRLGCVAGIDVTWSAVPYVGTGRGLVAALKFERALPLARLAAARIADAAPEGLLDGALVPVPPAPLRMRIRGFDAAEEIALELAMLTGLGLEACLRRGGGPRQVGRPRSERLASPPRMSARCPAPHKAILVDDVLTTGATLGTGAAALRRAGAKRVVAVTFATSPIGLGATARWA